MKVVLHFRRSLVSDPRPFFRQCSNAFSVTAGCPYLGESGSIPNAPHLIIVPGTVLSQWASEIRIFLNPKAFDLFMYQTGEQFRKDFWSDSGPFAQSKQPRANKIILAPHSVCQLPFLFYLETYCSARHSSRSIVFCICGQSLRQRRYHGVRHRGLQCTIRLCSRPSSGLNFCRLSSMRPMNSAMWVQSTPAHWRYCKTRRSGCS
jgi:hypothetical protein